MIDLGAALSSFGIDYVAVRGWQERRRPGPFDPQGIIVHHTASTGPADLPSLNTVTFGRAGIPGPLCNILIGRSGSVRLISNTRASDSGMGSSRVLHEVVHDNGPTQDAADRGLSDDADGNPWFYDIEVENNGTGEPYPSAVVAAVVGVCAAICKAMGWSERRVIHHRTWTRRKIDMSYQGDLRAPIAVRLTPLPPSPPEDYMPLAVMPIQDGQPLVPKDDATKADAWYEVTPEGDVINHNVKQGWRIPSYRDVYGAIPPRKIIGAVAGIGWHTPGYIALKLLAEGGSSYLLAPTSK